MVSRQVQLGGVELRAGQSRSVSSEAMQAWARDCTSYQSVYLCYPDPLVSRILALKTYNY